MSLFLMLSLNITISARCVSVRGRLDMLPLLIYAYIADACSFAFPRFRMLASTQCILICQAVCIQLAVMTCFAHYNGYDCCAWLV